MQLVSCNKQLARKVIATTIKHASCKKRGGVILTHTSCNCDIVTVPFRPKHELCGYSCNLTRAVMRVAHMNIFIFKHAEKDDNEPATLFNRSQQLQLTIGQNSCSVCCMFYCSCNIGLNGMEVLQRRFTFRL
jgi:hypothetical protein